MAGSLSLFFDCTWSDVVNVTSIPTDDGVLGESSSAYVELSSLNWKGSDPGKGDPKVESGSNLGNSMSIPTGGALGEPIDVCDELSSLSWKNSGEGRIRRRVLVSMVQVDLQLTMNFDEYSIPAVIIWQTMKDLC